MSIEIDGQTGDLPPGKVGIVVSRYNRGVCDAILRGAIETLTQAGLPEERLRVIRVPGAWELPLAVKIVLGRADVIAAVALGAVIRGETSHDEHINRAVSMVLMEASLSSEKPVGFGLLTCHNLEQAIQRSGGTVGNKGAEAAEAVLEMLRLATRLSE